MSDDVAVRAVTADDAARVWEALAVASGDRSYLSYAGSSVWTERLADALADAGLVAARKATEVRR